MSNNLFNLKLFLVIIVPLFVVVVIFYNKKQKGTTNGWLSYYENNLMGPLNGIVFVGGMFSFLWIMSQMKF